MLESVERRLQAPHPVFILTFFALSVSRGCLGLQIYSSCTRGNESTFAACCGRSDGVYSSSSSSSSSHGCSTAYGRRRRHGRQRSSVSRAAFSSDVDTGDIPTTAGLFGYGWSGRDPGCRRRSGGGVGTVSRKRSRWFADGKPGGAMRMARDLYEVLNVPDTADGKEIKRAYRREALKTHPDVNTSLNAKTEFAEVVKAYEVLSDEKRRQSYDLKRKFTGSAPFDGGRAPKAGTGAGGSSGGAPSWRRTAEYDRAREEASRRWKAQNPSPGEIDDSFGDILKDLFGGVAAAASAGGGGVLKDLVNFLENRVDGFSSDTSPEFEDLMSSGNLEEMKAEVENTRLLLKQLQKRSSQLNRDRFEAKRELSRMKAEGMKRVADIAELDRQMAAVEKEAGITARFEEIQGHVKRAQARLGRLERKVADMRGVSGSRRGGGDGSSGSGSGTRYSSYPSRGSGAAAEGVKRAPRVDDRWRSSTTTSSAPDSGNSSSSSSSSSSGRRTGGNRKENGSSESVAKSPPPPALPRTRKMGPGGRRRADDPEVEAELARLKREMGL